MFRAEGGRSNSRLWLISVIVAFAVVAGGSANSENTSGPVGWEEPAWMSRARDDAEQNQLAMMACMQEFGADGVPAMGGGVVIAGNTDEDPAVHELRNTALDACTERIGFPELWLIPPDQSGYERMVDAYHCILALGYEISAPPSLDVWLDQSANERYFPHRQLTSLPLSSDELQEAFRVCPQPGSLGMVVQVHSQDLPS